MKIPGYKHLVDVIFPELKKEMPKLAKGIVLTGFDVRTGLFVDSITDEGYYIRKDYVSSPVFYTYEEMLHDNNLRGVLNYALMWLNKLKYDRYVIATTGNPNKFFTLDLSEKGCCNMIREYGGYVGNKGINIDPIKLSSMPLITKDREFMRVDYF